MNPDVSVVRTPDDLIDVVPKLGPDVLQDICFTQVIINPPVIINEIITKYLFRWQRLKKGPLFWALSVAVLVLVYGILLVRFR